MVELNSSKKPGRLAATYQCQSVVFQSLRGPTSLRWYSLATGQDIAQVVESSSCLMTMQK